MENFFGSNKLHMNECSPDTLSHDENRRVSILFLSRFIQKMVDSILKKSDISYDQFERE